MLSVNNYQIKKVCLLAIILCICSGCQDESKCLFKSNIEFDKLVTNEETGFCFLKERYNNYVLQNQSEYEELVGCNQATFIDFDIHTLLAGSIEIPTTGRVSSQSVKKDCKNRLIFKVDIQEGNGQAFSTIYYFAIISKIQAGTSVNFDVKYVKS
jgi:hypothetical protein